MKGSLATIQWREGTAGSFLPCVFLAVVLFLGVLGGCAKAKTGPDPLLAAGERGFIGVYTLDNLVLGPGMLVKLRAGDPMFSGRGQTADEAVRKGIMTERQLASLTNCTMVVAADHSYVITNFPSLDLAHKSVVRGTWSIQVYHAFDAYGYRITIKDATSGKELLRARFINADKPEPPILEIFYQEGSTTPVIFRFERPHASPRLGRR